MKNFYAGENVLLNILRTLAALIVCIGHIRGQILLPRASLEHASVNQVLYMLTSLGHGAVIVFFVLSGYFVGGEAIRAYRGQRLAIGSYMVKRLSRLWTVLLPALVLTCLLDSIGIAVFGDTSTYSEPPWARGFLVFLGNLFFLQSKWVPAFGTDHALWSLAYEFAYYLAFPFVLIAVAQRKTSGTIACCIAIALLFVVFGATVLAMFPIWLVGAGAYLIQDLANSQLTRLSTVTRTALATFSVGALVVAMALDKFVGGGENVINAAIYIEAVVAAALILQLSSIQEFNFGVFNKVAARTSFFSRYSYSLYAIHMPILAILVATMRYFGVLPFEPKLKGWIIVALTTLACAVIASMFGKVTEDKTPRVRDLERFPA